MDVYTWWRRRRSAGGHWLQYSALTETSSLTLGERQYIHESTPDSGWCTEGGRGRVSQVVIGLQYEALVQGAKVNL